mmetsp:Transcript_94831/g.263429  ORF Transcript_94831/g.263429 Transcript_94831/m.263429 type:complete len:303 (+) Transcript_94831:62-970(+)
MQKPSVAGRVSRATSRVAAEDRQRLLERLDLVLSPRNALLVGLALAHACGLELLVLGLRGGEDLLDLQEVLLLVLQRDLRVLVRPGLMLDIGLHLRHGDAGLLHELVVLRLRCGLGGRGLLLDAGEVGLDDVEHRQDAAAGALLPGVGAVFEDRWGRLSVFPHLRERRGLLRGVGIEVLEDLDGIRHGSLAGLGVLDGGLVLNLLRQAKRGLVGHGGLRLVHRHGQRALLFLELHEVGLEGVDVDAQAIDLLRLRLPRVRVGGQLLVAPTLVLRLAQGLGLQALDELLDQGLHLRERVVLQR